MSCRRRGSHETPDRD